MDTSSNLQIVSAEPVHYDSIAEIYNEHIRANKSTMVEKIMSAEDIGAWINSLHSREGIYVLLKQNEVIGWGNILRYGDRRGYRFACLTSVFLKSTELQQGYGTMLKKFIIDKCRALNYHHLVAKIFASNEASINYNLKLGYTIVGTQKEIGFKNGKWQDVVIMQLIL